jgi:hypothetical protein
MAKKLIKGVNDLQIAHPELVKEWHPTKNGKLTPYNVRMGQIKMRISPFFIKMHNQT